MAKHHRSTKDKHESKNRRRNKAGAQPTRNPESAAGQIELSEELAELAGQSSMETQATHLGDSDLQTAQRQSLAAQIGQEQGNRHLQRVMASLRGEETAEQPEKPPADSANPQAEGRSAQARSDQPLLQTDPNRAKPALSSLPSRGPHIIQRTLGGSFPTSHGVFEMGMETKEGAKTGTGKSGLQGTIKFVPSPESPYSNKIGLIQIVKLTTDKGANVNPRSMPATTGPHVRTEEDKAGGVEKGFFTDVLHQDPFSSKTPIVKNPGDELLPYYAFAPSGPRKSGDIFGFKRSKEAKDIKPTELYDFPGTSSKTAKFDFSFETVAKGDDNMFTYGAVKWSFGLRKGEVVNEDMSISDTGSATFDAALKKHRDFYIHEPVTFYFGFDRDTPDPTELAKIDTFLGYLKDFPDVELQLTGFADLRGNPDYNMDLAERRAESIAQALVTKGVDPFRIRPVKAKGETTGFTSDVKSPAEQDRDALRRANRRVTLTFLHTMSILPK